MKVAERIMKFACKMKNYLFRLHWILFFVCSRSRREIIIYTTPEAPDF